MVITYNRIKRILHIKVLRKVFFLIMKFRLNFELFFLLEKTGKILLHSSFEPLTLGLAKLPYHTALKLKILQIRF